MRILRSCSSVRGNRDRGMGFWVLVLEEGSLVFMYHVRDGMVGRDLLDEERKVV